MKRHAVSLLPGAVALLVLSCPAYGSAFSSLTTDEGGTEQPDESLEELTAERDDLRAQLATKNQEFLAQHSRADRLAAKVAALRRELVAEEQKEQGLQQRLSRVRSLVNDDAEAAEAAPGATSSAPVDSRSSAAPQAAPSAAAAVASAAPSAAAAEGTPHGDPTVAKAAPAAGAAEPLSEPGQAEAPRARVQRHGNVKEEALQRPDSPTAGGPPKPAEGAGGARPAPARVHQDHLEPRARHPGSQAAEAAQAPRARPARSRATLMSELRKQVSQLASSGQATYGAHGARAPLAQAGAASAGASAEGDDRPYAAARGRPTGGDSQETPVQVAEQSSTSPTAGADFDELETQLHEEDRKIDELDRESQDDATLAENVSFQGDVSASVLKVDLNPAQADASGDNSSLSAGSDSADDALFFSQLSKI